MIELRAWMKWVLIAAGTYNIASGAGMIVGYHEVYRMLGVPRPVSVLPLQMLGVMILLFGIGFYAAARAPAKHHLILVLGFWSKLIGFLLVSVSVARGELPSWFLVPVFFADLIYVPPFWMILRHLRN